MENINNNLFKVFIALMLVTFILGLFMGSELRNLRDNSDILSAFFTIGWVGIFYFIMNPTRWSWKSIVATSVAMPAMIIWLDIVRGCGLLYLATLVVGSIGLALGFILLLFNKFSVEGMIYAGIISVIAGIIISTLLWNVRILDEDIIIFSLFYGVLVAMLKWLIIPMVVLNFKCPPSLPTSHT